MKKLLAVLMLFSTSLFAVDNGVFELDGDAVQNTKDDWSTLYGGGGGATLFRHIVDKNGDDNIFTGGGSKVPLDFPGYKWKSSPPPPDKNNITNAYIANYVVSGEQIVYFGADLFSDNGDAELAFWLLQDDVGLNPDGTFSGVHVNGDVYVAVKFSNGGTVANIAVFEWDSTCSKDDRTPNVVGSCAAGNIAIVIPETSATCTGGGADACAITNLVNAAAPWGYVPKAGTNGVFPPTTFFEGGINIYDVFGENLCFSSVMVSTGASTSFSSTAKDFALGEFNVCSVAATAICSNPDEADDTPTAITYQIVGCAWNDGSGTIDILSLLANEGGTGDYVPNTLAFYATTNTFDPVTDCQLKAAIDAEVGGVSANISLDSLVGGDAFVYAFDVVTPINGPSFAVTVNAEGADGAAVDPDTDNTTCPVRIFDAGMNISKSCTADVVDAGTNLQIKINFGGQVCNTGEVPLTGLTLNDYAAAGTPVFNTYATTVPVSGCIPYTGYYFPDTIPAGDVCPFMDMVTGVANTPINSAGTDCTANNDGTATCTVNSNSATCELRVSNNDNDCSTGVPNPSN
jgi:hypothetical protein